MSVQASAMDPFQPCGIVTLTTDFGHRDPFVGVMKGRLLGRAPAARIVDLTHEIAPHCPAEAGFWLGRSFRDFPPGTVHVAVVDPGVGTSRDIVLAEAESQLFLAPDNGLLGGVLARLSQRARLRRLDRSTWARIGLAEPSATFHGRDVFAPLAAEIVAGRLRPQDIGPTVAGLSPGTLPVPSVKGDVIAGVVVTVDHFGNLLTNIDSDVLADCPPGIVVEVAARRFPFRRTYADVGPGEYLGLVNAFGVVEVARSGGNAAVGLAAGRGTPVLVVRPPTL